MTAKKTAELDQAEAGQEKVDRAEAGQEKVEHSDMLEDVIFTVKNTGVCIVHFKAHSAMPGESFEISDDDLSLPGVRSLIWNGSLSVTSHPEKQEEIKDSFMPKKDPDDGKTAKQLEDGGEY